MKRRRDDVMSNTLGPKAVFTQLGERFADSLESNTRQSPDVMAGPEVGDGFDVSTRLQFPKAMVGRYGGSVRKKETRDDGRRGDLPMPQEG